MTHYLSPPQEFSVNIIDYNANNEKLIRRQACNSTVPPAEFQRQLISCQENIFRPFPIGLDDLSCTSHSSVKTLALDATRPWRTEEGNDIALEHDNPLSQYLTDFDFLLFPFGGNESPQAGNCQVAWAWQWRIPPNEAEGLSMPLPLTDSSPQSPVGPSVAEHLSSQDFQIPFGGNEHSETGQVPWSLPISPSVAARLPTFSTTTTIPSAQPSVGPFAAGPRTTADDDIKSVGSPHIQQAAARRRKKGGFYQCPFDDCNGTFTERHNLRYHINAHLELKPYKCTKCSYAADSPATLKRHMKRHQRSGKGTGPTIEGMCELESS